MNFLKGRLRVVKNHPENDFWLPSINLLFFRCHSMKFHNCHHTTLILTWCYMCYEGENHNGWNFIVFSNHKNTSNFRNNSYKENARLLVLFLEQSIKFFLWTLSSNLQFILFISKIKSDVWKKFGDKNDLEIEFTFLVTLFWVNFVKY